MAKKRGCSLTSRTPTLQVGDSGASPGFSIMKLDVLTKQQCEKVRLWRNELPESLRTPYGLTEDMQEDFYKNTICNRNSPNRYWALIDEGVFIGMGGITNIQWENRLGEISLIINPEYRNKGLGEKAVWLILNQAFNYMNLKTVYGECYKCNPAYSFWEKLNNVKISDLPNRKFWNGKYYNSLYFSIDNENFKRG